MQIWQWPAVLEPVFPLAPILMQPAVPYTLTNRDCAKIQSYYYFYVNTACDPVHIKYWTQHRAELHPGLNRAIGAALRGTSSTPAVIHTATADPPQLPVQITGQAQLLTVNSATWHSYQPVQHTHSVPQWKTAAQQLWQQHWANYTVCIDQMCIPAQHTAHQVIKLQSQPLGLFHTLQSLFDSKHK